MNPATRFGPWSLATCLLLGACTVVPGGDRATFDFTGTGPVLPGNLNANRSIVTSAVLYCLRCLIDEELAEGRVVIAVDRPVRNTRGYYLCYPAGKRNQRALSAFRSWLLAQQ